MIDLKFSYPTRGAGRPQILLFGNGLEYDSNQLSWNRLIDEITVPDALPLTEEQRKQIPFPLLYQLLSTPAPAPAHLSKQDIEEEEQRLKTAVRKLTHTSNQYLNRLPSLGADHIMTTNYSYCLEKAFFPKLDFSKGSTRSRKRFAIQKEDIDTSAESDDSKKRTREVYYRMSTGYYTGKTALWHIHGECFPSGGIVLGHDRYCRLIHRIEPACNGQDFSEKSQETMIREFKSWPELFLYGDVYILGLGMYESEFDLWWLLRRKQRERYSDGRTYFYERRPDDGFQEPRHLLLKSCGVQLCEVGCSEADSYETFYHKALDDIKQKIETSKNT